MQYYDKNSKFDINFFNDKNELSGNRASLQNTGRVFEIRQNQQRFKLVTQSQPKSEKLRQ